MRRAKNYTKGVTRSPTGTAKQRRYNNTNKRKRSSSDSDSVPLASSSLMSDAVSGLSSTSAAPIQNVTSFALRTLFLEDIWFLEVGTPIVLFFRSELLPPRYAKGWLDVARDTHQSQHIPQVMCQGNLYNQLCGYVHLNPSGVIRKVTGTKTYNDIIAAMSERSQNGLYLKFPVFSPSSGCNLVSPPTDCIQQLLSYFEIFNYPQALFLQADYHPERSWYTIFKRLKASGGDRLTLLHRIVQETPGDRYSLAELRNIWQQFDVKQRHDQALELLGCLHPSQCLGRTG